MAVFKWILATFAIWKDSQGHADNQIIEEIPDHFRQLCHPDGARVQHPGADAYVCQALGQGDVSTGCRLYSHCTAYLVFYRGRNLYTDEGEYTEPLDAPLGIGLHHPGNHAARVLQFHYVSDTLW